MDAKPKTKSTKRNERKREKKHQVQAEGLIREIHSKENELERLNGLRRRVNSGSTDMNTRNWFRRRIGSLGLSMDYITDAYRRLYAGARTKSQQKLMLLRSAFSIPRLSAEDSTRRSTLSTKPEPQIWLHPVALLVVVCCLYCFQRSLTPYGICRSWVEVWQSLRCYGAEGAQIDGSWGPILLCFK